MTTTVSSFIADIFSRGFASFAATHGNLPQRHYKAARAIIACRTNALGGQREKCDSCGNELVRYHSCRDRHCPRCQTTARMEWVADRLEELLPVGYFHAVFTIPHELNPFALRNKTVFYNLMFRAVRETLAELAKNQRFLGADIGSILVLHTWGQTLVDHPHIHCIIPGGGYDAKRTKWKPAQNNFLFPCNVVARLYRGKLMAFFRKAITDGSLLLHGTLSAYQDNQTRCALIDDLYKKRWVVYLKPPFASPAALVRYLGNYTHRVAISDSRITGFDGETVSFTWKDYADGNRSKTMQLPVTEFIRRFMLHILPEGFKRIRYIGFLAPRAREKRLNRIREFFRKKPCEPKKKGRPWYQIVKELTGRNPLRCIVCGKGTMRSVFTLPRPALPGLPVTVT